VIAAIEKYGDEFSKYGEIDKDIIISNCGQFTYSKDRLPYPPMPPKEESEEHEFESTTEEMS